MQFIFCVVNQLEFCMASGLTQPNFNITNQHNSVGADIIRPRSLHKFIDSQLVGCGDLCQAQIVNKMFGMIVYTLRSENLP